MIRPAERSNRSQGVHGAPVGAPTVGVAHVALRLLSGLVERRERGSMAEQEPSGREPPADVAALGELVMVFQDIWSRRERTSEAQARRGRDGRTGERRVGGGGGYRGGG